MITPLGNYPIDILPTKPRVQIVMHEEYYIDFEANFETGLSNSKPEHRQGYIDLYLGKLKTIEELLVKFPYRVTLATYCPAHDYACNLCWQYFGPEDGACDVHHAEYPWCPLVLATEKIELKKYSYTVKKTGEVKSGIYKEKTYSDPGEHSHIGIWAHNWLCKTGYDFGLADYQFLNKADYDKFILNIPYINLGENYD